MDSEPTSRAAPGFSPAGEECGKQLLPPDAELPREVGGRSAARSPLHSAARAGDGCDPSQGTATHNGQHSNSRIK